MGLLDGPLKGVASNIIRTLGTSITLVEVQTGKFLPALDKSVLSKVSHVVPCVVSDNKGSLHVGDQKFSVPAGYIDGLIPTTDWYVMWDEVRYNINEVIATYASAEPVLFDLYATTAL